MYMCVYIYIYIYIYTIYIYIYTHVCRLCACIYIYICMIYMYNVLLLLPSGAPCCDDGVCRRTGATRDNVDCRTRGLRGPAPNSADV